MGVLCDVTICQLPYVPTRIFTLLLFSRSSWIEVLLCHLRTSLIEHYFHYVGQVEVCVWVAYFDNWTETMMFVFAMVYLFCLAHHLAKGNTLRVPVTLQSKYSRITLECLYIILIVVLSFAYASVPYTRGSYGLAGAWCWISSFDDDCEMTDAGLLDQLSGYLPDLVVGTLGIFLMVVIAVAYCQLPTTLREARLLLRKIFITGTISLVMLVKLFV